MEKTIGSNLKILRLKNNMSLAEVAEKLGLSAPGVLKFERDKINPSTKRLEEFAKLYNCSIDEILDTGKSCDIKFNNIYFKKNTSKIKIEKTKNILRNKIDHYFELLDISDIKLQNKFGVHVINTLDQAESLATKLRIFFTIPIDAPLSNLSYLLESNGIILITIPKDKITNSFINFHEMINNIPVIAVLEEDNGYDQRFSIAKALGDLLISSSGDRKALSYRFAESLLMPKQSLINEFGEKRVKIEFEEYEIYSKVYRVGYKNIADRLFECGIITFSNAKYTKVNINKNHIKEEPYTESANNYGKMLYKLKAKDQIRDLREFK